IVSAGISTNSATAQMSGTSMAAPHVAGVAALILGNARALTPAEVAARLSTDATRGVITGLNSSTVNALLYQRPTSNASSASFDDEEALDDSQNPGGGSDSSRLDYDEEAAPKSPVAAPVAAPKAPVASPNAPIVPMARISSAKKVGNKFRIVVSVPAGAKVVLYRNGKSIAS
ncbi:MAG: S8 family serine peptidase, partial [Acidimicrobiaceae bacterium]